MNLMENRSKLSLVGTPEPREGAVGPPSPERYPALAEAGAILGMSGEALRKKFERGDLPRRFLLHVGKRTLRIDLVGLIAHLKSNASESDGSSDGALAKTA
jgi:hypothetical protein